jgi:prepilin peptidase CpaA
MDALQQQLVFTGGALLCAGIASAHDVRDRRIPNWVTGPAIVAGFALHAACAGWSGLGDAALAGIAAGAVALAFYIAGGMGAGDVKLMVAVGCIAGCSHLPLVLISISFAGAVFALAVSLYHRRLHQTLANVIALLEHHGQHGLKPHPDLNLSNPGTLRLPFALPIAAGCLYTLCTLAWEAHT